MIRFALVCVLAGWIASAAFGQATYLQKQATVLALGDPEIPSELFEDVEAAPWTHWEVGPVGGVSVMATDGPVVWLGGAQGAVRFDSTASDLWERWQYFAGRRWLADDDVKRILLADHGVWIRTATGVTRLEWVAQTLADKAAYFEGVNEARHVRHGFVSNSKLLVPGDLSTNVTTDSDNDGLWTAMYVAAQSYRFAVTGSEDARTKARRGIDALMMLEKVDPIPGFYARTYRSFNEPAPHQDGGEWHPSPLADSLEWKGDTSSDESVGHYYGYAVYYDLVASDEEKEEIAGVVRLLTDYLVDNDWYLNDVDGKPTRWGVWNEAYFETGEGAYERALRSLELLSFLKTTWHITGDDRYQDLYLDRVRRGFAHHTLEYRRWSSQEWEINYSDDELYYLSIFPLLEYETDPVLRAKYLDNLRFTWAQVQPESNALWNIMSASLGAGPLTPPLLNDTIQSLQRSPVDLVSWSVKNGHRLDVGLNRNKDRHDRRELVRVVAPDERRMHKHNGNPYQADGGNGGLGEESPTYWLLPYWMGRYYQYIDG